MKKLLSFSILLLLISSIAFAQVEKGKWFVAGYSSLGLDIGSEKYEYPNSGWKSTSVSEYKYTEFDFNPYVGYFVIDKLPVGLFIDYEYMKEVDKEDDDTWKTSDFTIGPFVRYYIADVKGFFPYVEGRVGFGSYKETDEYSGNKDEWKSKIFTYKLGAGATYFLTDHVGLDLFLGYDHDSYKYEEDDYEETETYSSLEVNLGIVVTLGK